MVRKSLYGIPVLLMIFLMQPKTAGAATVNAASCSQGNVQSAINSASAGDTVVIPAGTCTYTTTSRQTPSVTINKAVTVQGQTVCTGRASSLSCTDSTIIKDGTGTAYQEDPFDITSSGARLTGITISDTRGTSDYKAYINVATDITNWRVDHNHITSNIGGTGTGEAIEAKGYGLVDHNYIQNAGTAVPVYGSSVNDATYPGDYSWTQPFIPGTVNAVYIEDNELNYNAVVLNGQDDYAGARFVFRYNDVQGTNIGDHGLDSGGLRGTLFAEIYNNTTENPGTHIYTWWVARAGSFLIFNNTISASGGSYDGFLDIRNYRSDSAYATSWGACDGTNVIDTLSVAGQQGWPCKDQVGRGPNQIPNPAYSWSNIFKGASPTIANINICGYQDCSRARNYHIKNNREFYNEVAGFDGTSGVGTGPLASRPATCSPVVGYWATDTNTLYKCLVQNTWTSYYTPFTYPHPLQGGSSSPQPPPAPTGLTAVTQ